MSSGEVVKRLSEWFGLAKGLDASFQARRRVGTWKNFMKGMPSVCSWPWLQVRP